MYSLKANTGHILLIWPVVPMNVWISLISILFLSPFLKAVFLRELVSEVKVEGSTAVLEKVREVF